MRTLKVKGFLLHLFGVSVFAGLVPSQDPYRLDIIHYNDFHARFEETAVNEAICSSNNASCLGGFARLFHHVEQLISEKPDALLLNAGDSFQGTFWYTHLKWNVTQEFMNLLPHDAHAIGNHEFDDGPEGLAPYLAALKAPVLAANLDTSKEPSLEGLYKPSIVVQRKDRKIGIIGLATTETVIFSHPGNVVFTDPGEAMKREAEALTKQGVDIIIVLSHCGLNVDRQLAREHGEYIDIIVGGHTHSLLWNGVAPSGEKVEAPYPVFVQSVDNKRHHVLIVQASSFTKYMGNLSVYFDENGEYIKWDGGPIFLDRSIQEDPNIKKKLEPYTKLVREAENKAVGESLVTLDSEDCANGECAFGNLLADAMVEYAKEKVDPSKHYVAIIEQNNVRSKINKGTIRQVDIFNIYPYSDPIELFELQGDLLKELLERSVSNIKSLEPFDAPWFLHISGLQVTYNLSLPVGKRIVSAYVGSKGSTKKVKYNEIYFILAPKFWTVVSPFAGGYKYLNRLRHNVQEIGRDYRTLYDYIMKHTPLDTTTDGRVVIYK